ncbi:MAG TPA: glycoside hydrolase family 25 protein [Bacillota bacterium]|nr:glycoside hydrolase family 25 protein [Bacillota bacterium]
MKFIFIMLFVCLIPFSNLAFAMQEKSSANSKGIDVSHYEGEVDWEKVKSSGVDFAYTKATEGNTIIDQYLKRNVEQARDNNILIGAFHTARPTSPFNPSEAVSQASFFASTLYNEVGDYGDIMPVLDLEFNSGLTASELAQWTRIFLDTTKKITHKEVILYTGIWFLQENGNLKNQFSDVPLWISYYKDNTPPDIAGWNRWLIWQYTDKGSMEGVGSNTDLNVGPTSLDALKGVPSESNHSTGMTSFGLLVCFMIGFLLLFKRTRFNNKVTTHSNQNLSVFSSNGRTKI